MTEIVTFEQERADVTRRCRAGEITAKEHDRLQRAIDKAQMRALKRAAQAAVADLVTFQEELDRRRARNHVRRKLKQSLRRYGDEVTA